MSSFYNKYLEACLSQNSAHASHVELLTDTIIAVAVSGTYVFDPTHQFRSSITTSEVTHTAALSSKSITDGTFQCADTLFPSVTGSTITAVVFLKDTGNPATSPLIAYINSGTGLPDTPGGTDISLFIDPGVHHVFSL